MFSLWTCLGKESSFPSCWVLFISWKLLKLFTWLLRMHNLFCVIHCKNVSAYNQSEHVREPTTSKGSADTCCGGSQSGACSGGGDSCSGGGDSRSGRTFEFANVIIWHGTNHVVYPITCIAQTTMSIVCPNPMGLVLPSIQVASIRVPFQLVETSTIFTIFIVRVW